MPVRSSARPEPPWTTRTWADPNLSDPNLADPNLADPNPVALTVGDDRFPVHSA